MFVPTVGNKAKKPRDPLLRHNSIDDEMRFTGLHSKADIPSKAFQRLNQLSINDDGQEVPAGKEQNEPSGRFSSYRGEQIMMFLGIISEYVLVFHGH